LKDLTRTLARYAAHSKYDELPQTVRHEGLRAFVNYVGCAAGGSREDNVVMMLKFLAEFNGGAHAKVIGHREKLDVLNATFVNCMSSAALAFNDTHFATVAHPTSPVAAALLALGERESLSGRELLHALILGVEIQCRVGLMLVTPPAQSAVGLSMQGIAGGIGAAVAAGKVLGLDEARLAVAIGLAANQSAGLRQAQATMASHFTPGHSARCGLQSALLFAREPNFNATVNKLGEVFEISKLAYKPYPAGVVIHPIIDACLEIVLQPSFDAANIARVELDLNPLAAKLTNLIDPKDRGNALVSFQYWTAVTLMHKAAGLAQISDAALHDATLRELRHKVSYNDVESVGKEAAHVRVVMSDGACFAASVNDCRGSVNRPMTDDDITVKTRGQLQTVYPEAQSARILDACWAMESCSAVGAFCDLLALENGS
jgi:2-methylcitrate dehydratase PrpD